MYWNMVLDQTGKSQWGWKQNSMITVDRTKGTIDYNPEFYLMKHLSYFVEPGAVKLGTSGEFDQLLAFENPDKSLIIVAYNKEPKNRKLKMKVKDQMVVVDLKPVSFSTIRVNL